MRVFTTLPALTAALSLLLVQAEPSSQEDDDYASDEKKEDEEYIHEVEDYMVNFMLFTRSNPDNYYLLQVQNNESISKSSFDASKDTKILIHGWKNAWNSNFSVTLREAYLERYDCNVINVDWSTQSHENYVSSRTAVSKVAGVVAQMVDMLVQEHGLRTDRIHMVGHSLGAHVAGIAGLRLTSGNLSRVTGLDPAMPLFTVYETYRLRADSAQFVDVIHTCGNFLAFETPLGQVDFYPNGGTFVQPGCGFDLKGKCSHSRSYLYFAESIRSSEQFLAVSCNDWDAFQQSDCDYDNSIPMGEDVPKTARGSYYLTTNSDTPFAKGPVEKIPTTTADPAWPDYIPDYMY